MTPRDVLLDGDCRDKRLAYVSICITENEAFLSNCLASLCSLLVTTNPRCVVAIVSRWVYFVANETFAMNGVAAVIAPDWSPLPDSHPYARLQQTESHHAKFDVWRLAQYRRVAYFDPDVLFMRNASGLGAVSGFAASRSPKGRDPTSYINAGVMVLRPSNALYNELVSAWRAGDYGLHYSDHKTGDNDVVMELCVKRGRCGPLVDLDACIYNYGVWLPGPFWRPCPTELVVARHNFLASREVHTAARLQSAMLRGTCRPLSGRAAAMAAQRGCFPEGQIDFNAERCCTAPSKWEPWGDLRCWGDGLTYERCCLAQYGSGALGGLLLDVGNSWYGLSTVPDNPPSDFLDRLCVRAYDVSPLTFAAFHSSADSSNEWPNDFTRSYGTWCESLRAPELKEDSAVYVLFSMRIEQYLERWASQSPLIAQLQKQIVAVPEIMEVFPRMAVCVPRVCCLHSMPMQNGVLSGVGGLRTIIWRFIEKHSLHMPTDLLPPPEARDFGEMYAIDSGNPDLRHLCA